MKDLSRHFVYAPADIIITRNNPDSAQKGFPGPVPLPCGRLKTIKFIAFLAVAVLFCAITVNQTIAGHSVVNGTGQHHLLNSASDRAGGDNSMPQNMPPVALCRNITVSLGPSGTVTVNATQVDAGSFDPDGSIVSRVVNPNTFSCLNIGANTVELIVTDDGGLTSTCNTTVIVQDNIAPQITCRNIMVYLNKTGSASVAPADLDNGSTDNCAGSLMLYLSRTEMNCSDIGAPVPVTLTGTDAAGNSASCISQVTVLDTIAPVVNLKRFNLVLGADGTGTVLPSDIDNGSFDNCGPLTLSVSPNTFTCGDVGIQEVVLTATDTFGNSRSRKVTITVTSTLKIVGITLNSCQLAVPFALYSSQIVGGDGVYSYFWKGMDESSLPFLVWIPTMPPQLQFNNTSTEPNPLFNSTSTLPDGSYPIRLVVTDGNGCTDTSFMIINKAGPVFNNVTLNTSDACEGDIRTYSAIWNAEASYQWNVVNGTILNADQDTSSISVLWDLGAIQGVVETTTQKPSQESEVCEYYATETVTIHPVPVPSYVTPPDDACSNTEYTYSLTDVYAFHNWAVTGGNITDGGSTSDNFVTIRWGNGPAGNITVTVESAEGCSSAIINDILINNLSGSVTSLTDITCNGISDGQVTVAATPGSGQPPYEYSLDGGPFQLSGTFTNLALGNHFVRIRDGLLCIFDVPFTITQPTVLMGSVESQTDVNCFGGSDGSLTISALGGTPPYEYSLNGGPYQGPNIFTGLSAGLYTVTIRDNNTCVRDVQAQVTEPFAPLAASVMAGNVLCYGDETGSVILTVTGGTTPYTYLWSNGSATKDITNLPAGAYTVLITDANGCTASAGATVTQPAAPLGGTVTVTDVLCYGGATGSLNLTVSGGTQPYTYLWSNGSTTEDLVNVTEGVYTVTITDANGCTITVSETVTQPAAPLSGTVTITNVSCFGGSDGAVNLTVTGGTSPYAFAWSNGAVTEDVSGLIAGTYSVIITDQNGCVTTVIVTVTQPSAPLAGTAVVTDVLCYGEVTGAIDLTVTGGTAPYTFLWSNGSVTEDLVNVIAGLYSVTITDANSCTVVVSATIAEPSAPLTGSTNVINVPCYGEATGSVDLTVTGGTAPYTFLWSNGAVTEDLTGLIAGTYTVTVTDANGCAVTLSASVTQPSASLAGSTTVSNVNCFGGNDGAINLTVTGGTPPYTFAWSNGAVTKDITGLLPGTFTVLITDQNGCTTTASATVTQPAAALTATTAVTDVLCSGEATGSINLTVSGGTAPYTFLWSNGSVLEDLTNVAAGTYTVTITDANGCTASSGGTITQPAAPLAGTTTVTNILCFGDATGAVDLDVTGGTLPYTFLWNNGPITEDLTNLIAGSYTVTVTDANGCVLTLSATVIQPSTGLAGSTTVSNVNCFGGNDGSINLTVTGGTLPYTFAWSNGAVTEDITGLLPGTFTVLITDQNGCSVTVSATVTQPSAALSVTSTVTDVLCNGDATGVIDLTLAGGTPPYTFLWSDGSTGEDLTDAAAGSYTVIITDANGCAAIASGTITQPPEALTGSITSQTNVSVYGGNDGSVTVAGLGGILPYQYRIGSEPYQGSGVFGSLVAGSYVITVQDGNLCTVEIPVTITQPLPPFSGTIVSQTNVSCFGGNDGSAIAEGIGGLPPYEYSLDGGPYQSSGTFASLTAGTYTITIRNAASDTYNLPLVITEPVELAATATGTDALCAGQASGTATVVVTGGTEPWSYAWNTTPVQTGATAINLAAGLYTVTVTDANGCETSADVTIEEPPDAMVVTITKTDVRCYGSANGTAEAVVSGGAEPYAYSWNTLPVQTSATATGLDAGNYTVTITDANGCMSTGSVQINEPDLLVIQSIANDATCPDEANGSIILTITGGTEPYTIIWSDGAGMQNRINMLPGTYSVVVTDQNGCSQSHSVVVGFIGTYNCVEISNIITPNNDGFNDEWILKNIDLYPNAEVLVFNRWGKLIFRTKNISANPWDGTSEGKLVPTDSYHYILYLNDGSEPKTGVISVIR